MPTAVILGIGCSCSPLTSNFNCNCNLRHLYCPLRPRAHHRLSHIDPYPGFRKQNETEMFSDHYETVHSSSISSVPCFMLAVQQQKRLCRQFVDVSAARRGCHAKVRSVDIDLEYWQPMSDDPRCFPACVPGVTCGPTSTICTGSSQRLATSATLEEPQSHGHVA